MLVAFRQIRGIFVIFFCVVVFFYYYAFATTAAVVPKKRVNELHPLQTQCSSFESISNDQFDLLVKKGIPSCKKTVWGRFSVYLTILKSQSGDFPIVVYENASKPSNAIIHIHGGPRILTGLIEPMLIYGRPLANSAFIRPVYMGSLNRTRYPKPDFGDAVDEIRQTIKTVRLSKLKILLSADSAGSFILKKSCIDFCLESTVYIAPMTLNPHNTSNLNKNNSFYCLKNPASNACNTRYINDSNIRFFADMRGNSFSHSKELLNSYPSVQLDGNDQFRKFFGNEVFYEDFRFFSSEDRCADVIYDELDPIIGVQNIERYMHVKCPDFLHKVKNFRHSFFVNSAYGISVYWNIVKERSNRSL